MTYLEETKAAERVIFPDLARASALIGIALVNVGVFAYPMYLGGYAYSGPPQGADYAMVYGVNALFLMKSYTLFAFMFGVGFAYQMASAERAETAFPARYGRRILGLFAFAALNIALLFEGDILFIYAVLGSFLLLFRHMPAQGLIRWAMGLYLVQVLLLGLFAGLTALGHAMAPEDMASEAALAIEQGQQALAMYGEGGFSETVGFRIHEWTGTIGFIFLFQGVGAMSFFLFGLAAVRNDLIAQPSAPFWRTARRICLPIGLVISGIGAFLISWESSMMSTRMMTGMVIISLGAPFSTAGYLGLIAKWSLGPDGPVKTFIARGGTASLTAYLLQNLLFTLIFYAYGLGYYAELSAAICIIIAALTGVLSLAFTSLWRMKFRRGPLEYVLRSWTYFKFSQR